MASTSKVTTRAGARAAEEASSSSIPFPEVTAATQIFATKEEDKGKRKEERAPSRASSSGIGKDPKLAKPLPFDGNPQNLRRFLKDCVLYMTMNPNTFDEDSKKIGFILSLMSKGTAQTWKEDYLDKKLVDNGYAFDNYQTFSNLDRKSVV